MGKLTTTVFDESCCDGGECYVNDMSAQPCGCDPGCNNHMCERHRLEARLREELDAKARHHNEEP